jgi:hypothetical protein
MRYAYREVLAMVRDDTGRWTQAVTTRAQVDRLARQLSNPLLSNPHANGPRGSGAAQVQAEAFYGQVRNALDALVAEGVIRKSPKSHVGPDGLRNYGGLPRYWTPALWEAAEKDRDARRALKEHTAERWAAVNEALTAAGIGHANLPTAKPSLNLATWEHLVTRLLPPPCRTCNGRTTVPADPQAGPVMGEVPCPRCTPERAALAEAIRAAWRKAGLDPAPFGSDGLDARRAEVAVQVLRPVRAPLTADMRRAMPEEVEVP